MSDESPPPAPSTSANNNNSGGSQPPNERRGGAGRRGGSGGRGRTAAAPHHHEDPTAAAAAEGGAAAPGGPRARGPRVPFRGRGGSRQGNNGNPESSATVQQPLAYRGRGGRGGSAAGGRGGHGNPTAASIPGSATSRASGMGAGTPSVASSVGSFAYFEDEQRYHSGQPVSGCVAVIPTDATPFAHDIAQQLVSLTYECANCLDVIQHPSPTWSCHACFRIFHWICIRKWSVQEASGAGRSFRCPHCQAPHPAALKYLCFCTKQQDPKYDPIVVPHSCGEECGKLRRSAPGSLHPCPHKCSARCHPGPCADCKERSLPTACPCGRTSYTFPCGGIDPKTTCENLCGKPLSCGSHVCMKPCHHGPCSPCDVQVSVSCVCHKSTKQLPCGSKTFDCSEPCGKTQRCGNHQCSVVCHSGSCPPCERDPSVVSTCCCGKQPLETPRTSCTDPIPTCGAVCGKMLSCSGEHTCRNPCHDGPCETCKERVTIACPCRSSQAKVECQEGLQYRCHKKCKTRLSCGKHECEVICCDERNRLDAYAHRCRKPCGKRLACGHPCKELCHTGSCPPCDNIITTPLFCRCGEEVLMPPQPCSTAPPRCYRPCRVPLPCGHDSVYHDCHHGDCPPCGRPVDRQCAGGHTTLSNVLCSAPYAVCNRPCGKLVSCGHLCNRACHHGDCAVEVERKGCGQPCGKVLPGCGHNCLQKCHPTGNCGRCTNEVEVQCECGNLRQNYSCAKFMKEREKSEDRRVVLPCNLDCTHKARLGVLAALHSGAAGTSNPPHHNSNAMASQGPRVILYSTKLWTVAKSTPDVIRSVENHLIDFVKGSAESLVLPAMEKDKRAVVHEMAYYFHVHTESMDHEPNRTIYLTKTLSSQIPDPLLSEVMKKHDARYDSVMFARRVLMDPDDAKRRVIVFRGAHLAEATVNRTLRAFAGLFVLVHQDDAPDLPYLNHELVTNHPDEGTVVFFAVFQQHEIKQAYASVRKTGCPVMYHLLGHAPPPRNFIWEPSRDGETAADPGPVAAGSSSRRAAGGGTWSSLVQSRETSRAKKTSEQGKVDVKNMFDLLRR